MNQVHVQTVLASKAARVVEAAQGRPVVDFGLRRMHGIDAGIKAVRAYHIAGVDATSNVAGGQAYGVGLAGTMAHSYVQAHDDEYDAFRAFAPLYPDTTLLVDTYDTLAGVRKVIDLARELGTNFRVRAVRLDSGNLEDLAVAARAHARRCRTAPGADLRERRAQRRRDRPAGDGCRADRRRSASARTWPCRATRRVSTSCTSSSSTPAGHGSSCRPARPCCRAGSRSFAWKKTAWPLMMSWVFATNRPWDVPYCNA